MKKLFFAVTVFAAIVSCGDKKPVIPELPEAAPIETNDTTQNGADPVAEEDDDDDDEKEDEKVDNTMAGVKKWTIRITGVSTSTKEISEEEAKKLESSSNDDVTVNYDDATGKYTKTTTGNVVVKTVTITDPGTVAKLKAMMEKPEYRDYSRSVSISNGTASATWYGGNRGGGIEEEFPSDVAGAILK